MLVEGALPGERVQVEVVADRRDFARARVVAVLDPSPDRVDPPCPHRRRGCGGCPWQEVAAEAQVRQKEAIVADALRRIAGIGQPPLGPTVRLPTVGYRTTVHVAIDADGGPAFRPRHGAGGLVAVDSCLVAHPAIADALAGLRLPGRGAATLRVGVAGGERLVVLPGGGRRERRPPPLRPGRRGQDGRREARFGEATVPDGFVLVGPSDAGAFNEDAGGRRWRVSARSFFQAGPAAANALADAVDDAVGEALPDGGRLVDAYAGVGLLGGVLASRRRGVALTAVESDPGAGRDAAVNLADLDARVVVGEVGRWVPRPADVVVADPARTGLGRPGVSALTATGAARIVLVSCDPASLGRDAGLLAAAAYRLRRVWLLDVVPHTVHTETVSVFEAAA